MKRARIPLLLGLALACLWACGTQRELADIRTADVDGLRVAYWEDRTYVPFCVVEKASRGAQIGYLDGDRDDRVSQYKDYPAEEWLVSWMPMEGGAMLRKEEGVTDIPEGLQAEYQ